MARVKKPIELRMVDEESRAKVDVVRLGDDEQPLRLIPENQDSRQAPAARLEAPDFEAVDNRRSHEPGLEVLIDPEMASLSAGEDEWDRSGVERGPVAWGWFVLVGLLLAGAVTWSVTRVQQAETAVKEEHAQAVATVNAAAESERQATELFERMERVVRAYCLAGSIKEMLPLVRHPARVGPLMENYYAQESMRALGFRRVQTFQGARLEDKSNFWVFTVTVGDGKSKQLVLEQEASGNLLVDWETAVIYQPMKWDRYALERPKGSTLDFRVYVDEDHFFSHEFADSNLWVSFRLRAANSEETLFGYAAKDSEVATTLLALVKQGELQKFSAILRLRLPEGLLSRRGVIIEKVINARWIYVNSPDADP